MKNIKKIFTLKRIIIFIILVAAAGGIFYYFQSKKTKQTSSRVIEHQVERKDLAVTLTGSGAVEQSYRQAITPYISGTVKKVYFKEGYKVKAGDLMIEFDDTTIAKDIERAELSIQQAQRDYNDVKKNIAGLTVTAPISGQITGLTGNIGDDVNKGGVICSITDTSKLKLKVPFNKKDAKNFYIGEKADVYLQDYMQTVEGRVNYINKRGNAVDGGGLTSDVEIIIDNPGTIKAGIRASASVGGRMSLDNSALEYFAARKVKCEPGGTITNIAVRENQYLSAGQEIMRVENPDLNDTLLSCEMKLQDLQAQLDSKLSDQKNYKITAPGNGTIVAQTIKAGDVVKQQDTISTIADNEGMQFDINIDELDIDKISVGMKASVTLDALTNEKYTGVVTQVASEGTSTNGVSTYPVTIKIDNPVKIKAGMNANADIIIQQKSDILTLPVSAVQKMGNMALVYVRESAGQKNQGTSDNKNANWQNNGSESRNKNSSSRQNGRNGNRNNSRMQSMLKTFGPDVIMKRISVGINNDNDIEIADGLNEGDIVLEAVTVSSSTSSNGPQMRMGGFGGEMGGFGGGNFQRRSGNSNRNSSSSGGGKSGND